MSAKTIGIIVAGFVAGVIGISVAMLGGSGWETPGSYTGVSDASHTANSSSNCYAFQNGCNVNSYGSSNTTSNDNGAYLSGSYTGP
ncbi:MAG: hypothetical protein ACREBB_06085 [Nitrosotalea sp.]